MIYRVDEQDRFAAINPCWDLFAQANGAPGLTGASLIGRRLWDFIEDAPTRQLHQVLAARVRRDGKPLVLPFRCDAPDLMRCMVMRIAPAGAGALEYACRVERTEQRQPLRLLEPRARSREQVMTMCSWCKRIEAAPDTWIDVAEAVADLGLFEQALPPEISHTICPDCFDALGNG